MKKTLKLSFAICFLLTIVCFLLTGCGAKTKIDEYKNKGNVICVSYNANGGTYLDREGITLIDMINPSDYEKDNNGVTHIKLMDPTDSRRPAGGKEGIYITRTNYFLVGWYQNKEIRKNNEGKIINENGEPLIQVGEDYFLENKQDELSTPAYDYSGYWDFENDTIDFTVDMKEYNLTLYAVWSTYFEFDYYYVNGDSVEYIDKTTFDYVTTNKVGSTSADMDTIWLPSWKDGALNYSHTYTNGSKYNFPKKTGYTFTGAYLDQACTQAITDSYTHTGSIDMSTGKPVNGIQNIYITYDKGELYHITSASQLINNADAYGTYIIEADLDFTDLTWPTTFSIGTFYGRIYGKDGVTYKFNNLTVTHSNETAKNGGLFGVLAKDSEISNIEFVNVTFDLAYAGKRNRDTNFGLFAGMIDKDANINNVTVSGTFKFGAVTLIDDHYTINLIANGANNKVTTKGTIGFIVYGTKSLDQFNYTVNPENVSIDEDNNITFELKAALKLDNAQYVIQ